MSEKYLTVRTVSIIQLANRRNGDKIDNPNIHILLSCYGRSWSVESGAVKLVLCLKPYLLVTWCGHVRAFTKIASGNQKPSAHSHIMHWLFYNGTFVWFNVDGVCFRKWTVTKMNSNFNKYAEMLSGLLYICISI